MFIIESKIPEEKAHIIQFPKQDPRDWSKAAEICDCYKLQQSHSQRRPTGMRCYLLDRNEHTSQCKGDWRRAVGVA